VEINQTFLCQISYSEKDVGSGVPISHVQMYKDLKKQWDKL
jgi:hypothetical protein